MAVSMSPMRVFCRNVPSVYSFFCGPRLLPAFRTLSTMQSMRIPAERVNKPRGVDLKGLDLFLYQIRKNLELRRFIPITTLVRITELAAEKSRNGEPISNSLWSEILSMSGEVLNVRIMRRKRITIQTWNFMKSCKGYKLDVSSYATYLMVCKENEMEIDITSLKEEMRQAGLNPNQEFYEELVGYHSAHGQLESVKEVLKEMQSASYPLTAKTLSNYIWAEFNAGYRDDLTNLFESASFHGVVPDLNCYMTMLKCYAVKGDMDKIKELILTAEKEVGMRQIHRIQLLVPLAVNDHEEKAEELLGSLCDTHYDIEKPDMNEIEYYGNQLVTNLKIRIGFKVFNLFARTAPFFIRSYARGPGQQRNDHFIQGYRMLNRTAASLTVQMVKSNVISWNRALLEAKTISEEYTACLFLYARKEGIFKKESYEQLSMFIEKGPSSKYFTDPSRQLIMDIATLCLEDEVDLDFKRTELKVFELLKERRESRSKIHAKMKEKNVDPATFSSHKPFLVEGVMEYMSMFKQEIENGNDDEVVRQFNTLKKGWNAKEESSNAKKLVTMYREKRKFEQAMHFLNVMVRANPSFPHSSHTLAYLVIKMLHCGDHRGIVKCINNYLDIAIEQKSKMAVIPHSQLLLILKVLVAFLRPAEVLQIFRRIKTHKEFFRLEVNTFHWLYMKRDVLLAVEALEEMMKYSTSTRLQYLPIMMELVFDDDQPIVNEVHSIAVKREGKRAADILLASAYLMNDRVEDARRIPETTTADCSTHEPEKDIYIIACIVKLISKPDMLNELVQLHDSPDFRRIIAEILKCGAGSPYKNTRQVMVQYMVENPDSALGVLCKSLMEPEQVGLEKLRLKMMKMNKVS